jgi:hypothetical protein
MSKLVLVTPEGRIVSDKQSPKVEVKEVEEPFHQMAARSAEQQSTPPLKVLSSKQETPSREANCGT